MFACLRVFEFRVFALLRACMCECVRDCAYGSLCVHALVCLDVCLLTCFRVCVFAPRRF